MKKLLKILVMLVVFVSLAGCAKKPSITVPSGVLEFTVGDKDFTNGNTEEKLLVGVTAVDNDNGTEAALKVIDLGGFDINKIGQYTITIEATSGSKKSATETRLVKVVDRTLPVLNVPNGILEFYEKDETFTSENISEKLLAGVTVTDAVDDNIAPTVSDLAGFDIAVVGEYVITITATNTGNKTTTATRTVKVLERSLPVITLPDEQVTLVPGNAPSEAELIEALKAKGLKVEDEFDQNPIIQIENLNEVDFADEGEYTLNLSVTDKYGKKAETTVVIAVYQNRAPEILSTGILVMNKISDSEFNLQAFIEDFKKGIIIRDDLNTIDVSDDGALDVEEINDVSGTFRPSVKGEYTYELTVTDAQGLKVTGTKIVKVVEPADHVVVIGNVAFNVASASNYMLNGTADPSNYQVAVYTSRGANEMMLPASCHAWLLDADRKLVQVLGVNELSSLEMNAESLLIIFGKTDSASWATTNEVLNKVVTLFNFDIYELLDAPEVTKQENILAWETVEGALQYQVYMNGELYATVNGTSFDLATVNGITKEENSFRIKAVNTNNRSLLSNEVTHTYTTSAVTVDVASMWFEKDGNRNDAEGDVLVWGSVENATLYRIYVDELLVGTVLADAGTTKYQYDLKGSNNSSWRIIPENYNFYDEFGVRYPYLDNSGNPIIENGEVVYKPLSTQTYNSWTFDFTIEAWVPNSVIAQSDAIEFVLTRITQPKLFASKYETGKDDVYDGIPEYNLDPHPIFIPGGTFAQFDQHLIENDSFIVMSQDGMDHMTSMSYKVNGNLEIMRLYPQTIAEYAANGILTPIPGLGALGMPGIYDSPAYVTSLSMLTMPKAALMDLALLREGMLTPNSSTVYYDAGAGDFFGVTFNPTFLMDPASTNDKFMLYGPAAGQSGVCVWSQLIFRGDNVRWYDSLPSERMLLTVPGRNDLVASTIMNFAPGSYEIIG